MGGSRGDHHESAQRCHGGRSGVAPWATERTRFSLVRSMEDLPDDIPMVWTCSCPDRPGSGAGSLYGTFDLALRSAWRSIPPTIASTRRRPRYGASVDPRAPAWLGSRRPSVRRRGRLRRASERKGSRRVTARAPAGLVVRPTSAGNDRALRAARGAVESRGETLGRADEDQSDRRGAARPMINRGNGSRPDRPARVRRTRARIRENLAGAWNG